MLGWENTVKLTVELGGTERNGSWPVLTPGSQDSLPVRACGQSLWPERRKGGFCTAQASYPAPAAAAAVKGRCFSSTAALLTGPVSVAAVFEYS